MNPRSVLGALAEEYPQLYLDPDAVSQEEYRRIVLRGEEPDTKSLDHYSGDPGDKMEIPDTPAGSAVVVTLGNRKDFELVIRGMLAAKEGPEAEVPPSQGAAMITAFNWKRINDHMAGFPEEERNAEFKRFTAVRDNYIDQLVILSRGPYSKVPADKVGHTEDEWVEISDTIRRYHELTHVICRSIYPGDIAPIRDELVADAVGLYAAYGCFDPETEKLFLGIRDGRYVGGRLGNYKDAPESLTEAVCDALERVRATIDNQTETEPFQLIPALMQAAEIGDTRA